MDELIEQIVALRSQERKYTCNDYLRAHSSFSANSREDAQSSIFDFFGHRRNQNSVVRRIPSFEVTAESREEMCEWFTTILDFYHLERETLAISMSYLDRFLSTDVGFDYLQDKRRHQLAGVTALYIAIKITEPVNVDLQLVQDMCCNRFSDADIATMERTMLQTLDWRLSSPTPLVFVLLMVDLLPARVNRATREYVADLARYQTEAAVANYTLVTERASTIALAAVFNGMGAIDRRCLPMSMRSAFCDTVLRALGVNIKDDCVSEVRRILLPSLVMEGVRPGSIVSGPVDEQKCSEDPSCPRIGGADFSHCLSPVSVRMGSR